MDRGCHDDLKAAKPTQDQGVMGVDLGIKVPAVSYVAGKGSCFYGNGRYQRYMRRRFYARRKALQKAGKKRALRKSQGKEQRWMKNSNHLLSHQIVHQAQHDGVGTITLETLFGIRERTTRTSRGAKARKKQSHEQHLELCSIGHIPHLTKPNAWGSRSNGSILPTPPRNALLVASTIKPGDRRYCCSDCGWKGHRDAVGAVAISRRTGLCGHSTGATGS